MDNADPAEAISFGTDGWRATLAEFTPPRVRMVGQAVASMLTAQDREGGVAIGYDPREHSRSFAEELTRVLAANGRDVTIADRDCPTPVLAWNVATGSYAGGLMVTASHNPPSYNGVKFIPADGTPALPAVTEQIEASLGRPDPLDESEHGRVTESDLRTPYLDHAIEFLDQSLDGQTVAYDAIHGSGRGVTDRLLDRAGATVRRYRCEHDDSFGGVSPEPAPDTAETITDVVTDGDADLGFINDGDADRLGVVTPERGYLDPNVVLAVLYSFLLESDGGDVVRTVSTSSLVDRIAREYGHAVHETPVGFKWVAQAMGEHDTLVGGEESGGYGVTAHLRNKDGVVLAGLLAAADRRQPLDERIETLLTAHGPVYQDRTSIDCERKDETMRAVEEKQPETIAETRVTETVTADGVKYVLADDSWLLIRPSGTEPKLRIYAEATSKERIEQLLAAGESFLKPLVGGD